MKLLYLECNMGGAGDMLMAALLELLPDREAFLNEMNNAGIPGVRLEAVASEKCGIKGLGIRVTVDGQEEESLDCHSHSHDENTGHSHEHNHEHSHSHSHSHHHSHSGLDSINHLISGLSVPEKVKSDALKVYKLIAQAESAAHGVPISEIHFHEVGTKDALADIIGVCLLINRLAPDRILASPVHVGSGHVRCAHGVLPVPAPATAHILNGVPIYGGRIKGELCTPTGAALLKHFVSEFGDMPVMKVDKIGYGMGKKDFEFANCLRAVMGESMLPSSCHRSSKDSPMDEIIELRCNLDDMTPEAVGFAQEQLFAAGALDVFTIPITMKKNRPSILFTCLCRKEACDHMVRLIFRHTTTLGIRQYLCSRYILNRTETLVQTEDGPLHIKESSGWGIIRRKAEYDDVSSIAKKRGCSFQEASDDLKKY